MKQSDKDLILAALRSGEYKQGSKVLTRQSPTGEEDCCLGVICKIFSTPRKFIPASQTYVYAEETDHILPSSLCMRLGMTGNGILSFIDYYGEPCTLTQLNDDGLTFSQIADVIDYEWPGEA